MAAETHPKLGSAAWVVLTFFAVSTGLGALRYGLPSVPFPAPLPNFVSRHGWLVTHAVFSGIALLAGPWQFLSSVRNRRLWLHRSVGQVYCAAVAIGWFTSIPIAAHAQTGLVASLGFLVLGALWVGTTTRGYFLIRRRELRRHREWMIRSYALTCAAVTLRMYLPILSIAGFPLATGYPLVAWICWIPNVILAEWIVRMSGF